jgi:tetratricopeptide (TPR) repeat protein
MKKYVCLMLLLSLITACIKTSPKDGVARIGKKTISQAQFDAFDKARNLYLGDVGPYFPADRSPITHLVETELIYRQSGTARLKDSLKSTADWQWKKRCFQAQLVVLGYLIEDLNIPDEQIKAYYEAHKDSFKVTVKAQAPEDTSKKDTAKVQKDSIYYRPFKDVKRMIVDSLFLQANKPDSAYRALFDSTYKKQDIDALWLQHVRWKDGAFFMKKIYKEMTGKAYPDSLQDIFGEGKYITQAELDVVISWLTRSGRRYFHAHRRELVENLVRWKLFAAYAEKLGRDTLPEVNHVMGWAWKLNVAFCYINTVLAPSVTSSAAVDTAMLMYAIDDDNGYAPVEKGSSVINDRMLSEREERMRMKIDSVLVTYRRATPVTFLRKDLTDIKSDDPSALLKKADALRDSGKTKEAEEAYANLSIVFLYSPEGQTALVELAKLQTEQRLYSAAITSYRKYLLKSPDTSKRSNTFFVIGSIYDAYLNEPLPAEENYKWVLKNAPDCELADDAEFMMLHLGEPMPSVEELRSEAMRQGRKVDDTNMVPAATDTVQTRMADTAKK